MMNRTLSRFNEPKAKPEIGEIRLTTDGFRRRIFDGRFWQLLCAEPSCRLQAKTTCRSHRPNLLEAIESPVQKALKLGVATISRRVSRRTYQWQTFCQAENCRTRAKEYCQVHQPRISLPITCK